jgi:hypothetical protein
MSIGYQVAGQDRNKSILPSAFPPLASINLRVDWDEEKGSRTWSTDLPDLLPTLDHDKRRHRPDPIPRCYGLELVHVDFLPIKTAGKNKACHNGTKIKIKISTTRKAKKEREREKGEGEGDSGD